MMRKCMMLILIAVVYASMTLPVVAQSSENPPLAALDIAVWPEYDQQAVLVIYGVQIAADVSLPANISIHIPVSTVGGKPHAVAENDPVRGLRNVPYTVNAQSDWLLVSFTTAYRAFQVEFYDTLDLAQAERRYTLTWPGDARVDNTTLQVQEPFGVKDLQVTPAVEPGQRRDDGLIYHPANLGNLAAGQSVTIQLAYTKTDARLSVDALNLTPLAPGPQSTPSTQTSEALTLPTGVIVGIIVGVGLIIAGMVWYLYSRREAEEPGYTSPAVRHDRRGRRDVRQHAAPRSQRKRSFAEQDKPDMAGFCTHCGRPLSEADAFCPQCGTRKRGT